nr:hypothetical protein [Tanacetum cinerariifolium]
SICKYIEIATLNAKTVGNKTSGTTKPANPKVITPRMYAISPKYIFSQRRTNRETPIPLPKKKQVTFQETPKPSPRFTKKLVAPLLKKRNINVPLSTGIKSTTGASKPASKSNAWIYRKLPAKSAKGEKAKYTMRTTKKVWRPNVVTSVKPMWKPTGRHFTLYDSYPLTRILEPTVEPIELSLSISSSTKIPMLSKFVAVTLGMESPQLKSNQLVDRVMLNNSQGKKQKVEDHRRNVRFSKNKTSVTACNDSLNAKTLNVNFVCVTCGKCVLNDNHDKCVLHSRNSVNSRTKIPIVAPISTREPKRIVNQSVAKPLRRTVASESTNQKPRNTTMKLYKQVSKACSWWYPKFTPPGYKWKPKSQIGNVNPKLVEIILFIIDSGCSKHMMGNLNLLTNFVEKFLGTVKFRNDQIAPILGYGDLLVEIVLFIVNSGCSKYMTENLKLLINFVEKFLRTVKFGNDQIAPILGYGDLGNDLLTGSRGTDLYLITLQDTNCPNPICLMAKATSSQAWLWHRRLSHLNFDTINLLSKNDIVVSLPKLKLVKDHLCSFCELGKAKRKDGENLDKMKEKGNECIFVGYSTHSRAYRVFNKRTRVIMESIHVNFDELPHMALDHISSDPTPECQRMALEHDSLSPAIQRQ